MSAQWAIRTVSFAVGLICLNALASAVGFGTGWGFTFGAIGGYAIGSWGLIPE